MTGIPIWWKTISVFLQQELRSKDELIKSLMDTQIMVPETISKQNQFKKPDKNLSNFLQHQHKNYIEKVRHTSQHEQHFNLEQKPQTPSNTLFFYKQLPK